MNDQVTYRWVNGFDASPAEWDRIESLLATRGWMALNRATSRIRIAESASGELLGFHVFQLIPSAGPLFVTPSARGTGIAERLADDMVEFFVESEARGWIVIAGNPVSAKLCEARGMKRLAMPVYTTETVDEQGGR